MIHRDYFAKRVGLFTWQIHFAIYGDGISRDGMEFPASDHRFRSRKTAELIAQDMDNAFASCAAMPAYHWKPEE